MARRRARAAAGRFPSGPVAGGMGGVRAGWPGFRRGAGARAAARLPVRAAAHPRGGEPVVGPLWHSYGGRVDGRGANSQSYDVYGGTGYHGHGSAFSDFPHSYERLFGCNVIVLAGPRAEALPAATQARLRDGWNREAACSCWAGFSRSAAADMTAPRWRPRCPSACPPGTTWPRAIRGAAWSRPTRAARSSAGMCPGRSGRGCSTTTATWRPNRRRRCWRGRAGRRCGCGGPWGRARRRVRGHRLRGT